MAKKKEEVVEEAPVEEVEEVVEEAPVSSKNVAVVHYRGRTREYSKEAHGKDFKKLAASFAEKFGGEIK